MTAFTHPQLDELSRLIARRTGLNTFDRGRSRLIEVLNNHKESNRHPQKYIMHLEMLDDSHPVWQALLSKLTVSETYFMRESTALRQHILPALIQEKHGNGDHSLKIWSAGCATGEESYTLAILLRELLPDWEQWHIQILGTDINQAALEVAQKGCYREWSFRTVPADIRYRYFESKPPLIFEVRPELRRWVRFQYGNLVKHSPGLQDLVVCRNVLLYFTREQAQTAETQLFHSLRINGWLVLSPIETLHHSRHQYQVQRLATTLAYRKLTSGSTALASLPSSDHTATTSSVPISSTDEAIYQQALKAMLDGDYNTAVMLTRPLLETHQPKVFSLMASSLIGLGDLPHAHEHLMQALDADKFYPEAHYIMALIHMEEGNLVAARTALRAAIYCRPDFALAHLLSGDLFQREGDRERARRAWTTARRFANDLPSDMLLSDVADVSAGQLVMLVDTRLKDGKLS